MSEMGRRAMRDVLIEGVYERMDHNEQIYFLSADFGSPALDLVREHFPDRFASVGIAEQNLINIATGLALEGFTVFAYAIAPFLSMRAYDQIRTNLSLHAPFKTLNVNLIGVGTGLSYDVSGPTHHCLEDITLMRLLPGIELFSPSDWKLTQQLLTHCLNTRTPKYLRLDSKSLPAIYEQEHEIDVEQGFAELMHGEQVCLISTGFMTHTALKVAQLLAEQDLHITVIDLFSLTSYDKDALYAHLQPCSYVITLEEAFICRGGLDSLIADLLLEKHQSGVQFLRMGIHNYHLFEGGGREHLHHVHGLDAESISRRIEQLCS